MTYSTSDLDRIQKATGIRINQEQISTINSLQSSEQAEQFFEDVQKVVHIFEDSLTLGGNIRGEYAEEWEFVCKRIGIWFSYLSLLTPKRRGWFGKKEIPFPAKMMLSGVLSLDAPIMKSGALDI